MIEHSHLTIALSAAVPLWIEKIRDWSIRERLNYAQTCAQEIAEHGDAILYRTKIKGQSASAFNHLAAGIACLAFAPGGVKVFGLHFQA